MKKYIYILMCIMTLPLSVMASELPDVVIDTVATPALTGGKMYVFKNAKTGQWLINNNGTLGLCDIKPVSCPRGKYESELFITDSIGNINFQLTDINDFNNGTVVNPDIEGGTLLAPQRRALARETPVSVKGNNGLYITIYEGKICGVKNTEGAAAKWYAYEAKRSDHYFNEGACVYCGLNMAYRVPTYNTGGVAKSGIASWEYKIFTQNITPVASSKTCVVWNSGWYFVSGDVTLEQGAKCNGDVHLVLFDGANLTVNGPSDHSAIAVSDTRNSLTIYAQSNGENMGKLTANGGVNSAGIGGSNGLPGRNITIHGGRVTANGGWGGAGIGGGLTDWTPEGSNCQNIIINGGMVTAIGGGGGNGIGGGKGCEKVRDIIINGGSIIAKSANNATDAIGCGNTNINIYVNGACGILATNMNGEETKIDNSHGTVDNDMLKKKIVKIHEHDLTGSPTLAWADDCSNATATFTCSHGDTIVLDRTTAPAVNISFTTTATCISGGISTYDAYVHYLYNTYNYPTKEIETGVMPFHNYVNGICSYVNDHLEPAVQVTNENCEGFGLDSCHVGEYAISNLGQTYWWMQESDTTGILVSDIRCTGQLAKPFTLGAGKVLDGNGHRFSGNNAALIHQNQGTIRNLILVSCAAPLCEENSGSIQSCYVAEIDSATSALCNTNSGTIQNCVTTHATPVGTNTGTLTNVGTITAEDFQNGKAAWMLNGCKDAGQWRQSLCDDDYPTLDESHDLVYDAVNRTWESGTVRLTDRDHRGYFVYIHTAKYGYSVLSYRYDLQITQAINPNIMSKGFYAYLQPSSKYPYDYADVSYKVVDKRPILLKDIEEGITASFSRILGNDWGYAPGKNGAVDSLTTSDSQALTVITFNSEESDYRITFDIEFGDEYAERVCVHLDGQTTEFQYLEKKQEHYDSGVLPKGKHVIQLTKDMGGNTRIFNIKAEKYLGCSAGYHQFKEKKMEERYRKGEPACEKTVYYYACSDCGKCENNDEHTFTAGHVGHTFADGHIDGLCSVCHRNIPLYEGYDFNSIPTDAIDAFLTVKEADGAKLVTTGTGAKLSKGTQVYVPVRKEGDIVSVTASSTDYKILGNKESVGASYTANETDQNNGFVRIEATEEIEISSVTIQQVEYLPFPARTVTCNFAAMAQNAVNVDYTPGSEVKGNIHWEVWANGDSDTRQLVISGQGPIKDYYTTGWTSCAPWHVAVAAPPFYTFSSIYVSDGITRIGARTFMDDFANVTSIRIPEGISSLGQSSFNFVGYNSTLEELVIPASVKSISNYAMNCFSPTTLRFAEGSQIEYIGEFAFKGPGMEGAANALRNVIFTGATPPLIGKRIFNQQNINVYYPTEWGESFRVDENERWKGANIMNWDTAQTETEFIVTPLIWVDSLELATTGSSPVGTWYEFTAPDSGLYVLHLPNYGSMNLLVYESLSDAHALAEGGPEKRYIPVDMVAGKTYYFHSSWSFAFEVHKALTEGTYHIDQPVVSKTASWKYDPVTNTITLGCYDKNCYSYGASREQGFRMFSLCYFKTSYPYMVYGNKEGLTLKVEDGVASLAEVTGGRSSVSTVILPKSCRGVDDYSFGTPTSALACERLYISADYLVDNRFGPNAGIPLPTWWQSGHGSGYQYYLIGDGLIQNTYFLSTTAYNQVVTLQDSINKVYKEMYWAQLNWGNLHAPIAIQAKVGDATPVDLATCFSDGSKIATYTFSADSLKAKGINPCAYTWKLGDEEVPYGKVFTNVSENIVLVATPNVNHDFTEKALSATADPTTGLYYYACGRGCGTPDVDRAGFKAIKDYAPLAEGDARNLELACNGTSYAATSDIALTDANQFKDVKVTFTTNTVPTYTRTGIKNQWGTVVLPFDVVANSSDDYDLYEVSWVETDVLHLQKATGILAAGTPVLVRMCGSSPYTLTMTATGKTVSVSDNLTATTHDGLALTGAYSKTVLASAKQTTEPGYIISNNSFWNIETLRSQYKATEVYIGAFRAYLAGTFSSGASQLRIGNATDEEIENALEVLLSPLGESEGAIYDLNGRRLEDLQPGENIIKRGDKSVKVILK